MLMQRTAQGKPTIGPANAAAVLVASAEAYAAMSATQPKARRDSASAQYLSGQSRVAKEVAKAGDTSSDA